MARASTKSDLAYNKTVVMNGMMMPGVARFLIDYDINKGATVVTMTMYIKNGSLFIAGDRVQFETVAEPKKVEE